MSLNLHLHPKQGEALLTEATEVLYGGAAGGGKSHLMRVAAVLWCTQIPGLQAYLFRRQYPDLIKNHMEGPKGFRALLADMVLAGAATIVEDEIRFSNGSRIFLCHCKDEKHRFNYQGAEIHLLLIDELTHFTEAIYRFLRSRVRAVGLNLPRDYESRFPRILCGSNPGNIGHLWVKRMFVDFAAPMEIVRTPDEEGGMLRQVIPARLEDNPSMAEDDPAYRQRLRGLGSAELVRAMEEGDWNVIEGAFFDCWNPRLHAVRPFAVPPDWLRFRSMDWGSARPFSVGWWAVVPDGFETPCGAWLPRGALIRYREWYGCREGLPNTGLKLTAEAVGEGIAQREAGEKIAYGVLDPAAFAQDGGPSIAERMAGKGAKFRPADNKRVSSRGALGGWDILRHRLTGEDFGPPRGQRPMLYCFSTCTHSIRTIPALSHDEARPEDLDTNSEDHAADDWRYACMSRPWIPAPAADTAPRAIRVGGASTETFNDLLEAVKRRRDD